MKQPKFKMGERITVSIQFTNPDIKDCVSVDCGGVVCGVIFDPANSSFGAPFFDYYIRLDGQIGNNNYRAHEKEISTEEADRG